MQIEKLKNKHNSKDQKARHLKQRIESNTSRRQGREGSLRISNRELKGQSNPTIRNRRQHRQHLKQRIESRAYAVYLRVEQIRISNRELKHKAGTLMSFRWWMSMPWWWATLRSSASLLANLARVSSSWRGSMGASLRL